MYSDALKHDLVAKVVQEGCSISAAAREFNVPYGTAQVWVTQKGELIRRELQQKRSTDYTVTDAVNALKLIAKELRTLNRFLANLDLSAFN